jgi:hypothetical protein
MGYGTGTDGAICEEGLIKEWFQQYRERQKFYRRINTLP